MVVKKREYASVENFIDKGADVKSAKEKSFKNVLIRIHSSVLKDLDNLVEQKPWLNRTQWIVEAIHDKIKRDMNEKQK